MMIAGIEIGEEPGGPYRMMVAGKDWAVYPYRVSRRRPVTRSDLDSLRGAQLNGRKIVGVESFAVEGQTGKEIGLAFEYDEHLDKPVGGTSLTHEKPAGRKTS